MNKKIVNIATLMSVAASPLVGALPVYAADDANNAATATIKATNIEDEQVGVTAYRVIEPTYGANGLTGFKSVEGVNFADINNPTPAEVQKAAMAIINAKGEGFEKVKLNKEGNEYTGQAKPGMYIIIVSGSGKTVYNPGVVSVNYADAHGKILEEERKVDFKTKFNETAYMKSSTPTLTKTIVDSKETNKGDTVAVGQGIKFNINTTIPSYKVSEGETIYEDPTFEITDTLDTTFAEVTNIVVKNEKGALEKDKDYTLKLDKNSFVIKFSKNYLLAHGNEKVNVTYNTKLTKEGASKAFKANKNTAELKYSNDPTNKSSFGTFKEHTYNYSFNFDLKKVDQDSKALEGAEFGLYKEASAKKGSEIAKAKSGEDGIFGFEGLKEGTYYVREIKAPSGYSINDTVFKVDIQANLDDRGILKNYTMKVDGKDLGKDGVLSTFTQTPAVDKDGNVTSKVTGNYADIKIKNTKIGKMPSTGGPGTILLTGAGVVLFLGASSVFAKARKQRTTK